jgi:hypothetical protein
MDNFYRFWNKVNGEPYQDIPPPTKYSFQNMGYEQGHELKPLSHEDMARYATDDVEQLELEKARLGINPTRLGKPMSDEEFHRFYGLESRN